MTGPNAAMNQAKMFHPSKEFSAKAHVKSLEQYQQMYERSIRDPEGFWGEVAGEFHWEERWTKVREFDFKDKISIQYFLGGQTNICYNALDRHLASRGDQVAFFWEGNEPGEDSRKGRWSKVARCATMRVGSSDGADE